MNFISITQELDSLRERIKEYTNHRLSNGEWRETILRKMIRRHLPQTYGIGRGFVVTEIGTSSQIDIIIYDISKPLLYKEGDFVIVSIDSVIGVVEVKTKTYGKGSLKNKEDDSLTKLKENAELFNSSHYSVDKRVVTPARFHAYFSYERFDYKKLLPLNHIQFICLGYNHFIRYWNCWEKNNINRLYNKWHLYEVKSTAPAYFIYSIIDYIESNQLDFPVQNTLLFPNEDLEKYLKCKIPKE